MQNKNSPYLKKLILSHARLYTSIGLGILFGFLGPHFGVTSPISRTIIGYDLGALIYIAWATRIMLSSSSAQMRKRAREDDGKFVVLALVVITLLVSMSAIFAELSTAKDLEGAQRYLQLSLVILTIVASWFFTHTVFALHYAHDYYSAIQNGKVGGLEFQPANEPPDYFDFVYFSFVIGATAQTADVVVCSKPMRRILLGHSVLSFFFNTAILALAINMASSFL